MRVKDQIAQISAVMVVGRGSGKLDRSAILARIDGHIGLFGCCCDAL